MIRVQRVILLLLPRLGYSSCFLWLSFSLFYNLPQRSEFGIALGHSSNWHSERCSRRVHRPLNPLSSEPGWVYVGHIAFSRSVSRLYHVLPLRRGYCQPSTMSIMSRCPLIFLLSNATGLDSTSTWWIYFELWNSIHCDVQSVRGMTSLPLKIFKNSFRLCTPLITREAESWASA